MPRRTNEFQTLIRHVYDQLKPVGATVIESAMLKERGSSVEREVDVLLEAPVADTFVRIAIECRDRTRVDDIGWVDALIGKYRDLPIDKVVAVSSAGVTRSAAEKAAANRIEVRTLESALRSEWPSELSALGYARVHFQVTPLAFMPSTEPPWPSNDAPKAVEVNGITMTADRFIDGVTRRTHDEVAAAVTEQREELDSIADLNRAYDVDFELEIPDVTLISCTDSRHELRGMILRCAVRLSSEDVAVERHLLGDIGITVVPASPSASGERLVIVQRPGEEPVGAWLRFRDTRE